MEVEPLCRPRTHKIVIPDATFVQIFDLVTKVRDPESTAGDDALSLLDSGSQGSLTGAEFDARASIPVPGSP